MSEGLGWILCILAVIFGYVIEEVLHWPVGIGLACGACYIIGQNVRRNDE